MPNKEGTIRSIQLAEAFMLSMICFVIEHQLVDSDGLAAMLQSAIDACGPDSAVRGKLREMLAEVRWLS